MLFFITVIKRCEGYVYTEHDVRHNLTTQYACPDSKVHGANTGPTWGRQGPGVPHVGCMNLAFWVDAIVLLFFGAGFLNKKLNSVIVSIVCLIILVKKKHRKIYARAYIQVNKHAQFGWIYVFMDWLSNTNVEWLGTFRCINRRMHGWTEKQTERQTN